MAAHLRERAHLQKACPAGASCNVCYSDQNPGCVYAVQREDASKSQVLQAVGTCIKRDLLVSKYTVVKKSKCSGNKAPKPNQSGKGDAKPKDAKPKEQCQGPVMGVPANPKTDHCRSDGPEIPEIEMKGIRKSTSTVNGFRKAKEALIKDGERSILDFFQDTKSLNCPNIQASCKCGKEEDKHDQGKAVDALLEDANKYVKIFKDNVVPWLLEQAKNANPAPYKWGDYHLPWPADEKLLKGKPRMLEK